MYLLSNFINKSNPLNNFIKVIIIIFIINYIYYKLFSSYLFNQKIYQYLNISQFLL